MHRLHRVRARPSTTGCWLQHEKGDTELFSVYVPTNHVYVGDIFLLGKTDIIKTNLSVREGLGARHCHALCTLVHPPSAVALVLPRTVGGMHAVQSW